MTYFSLKLSCLVKALLGQTFSFDYKTVSRHMLYCCDPIFVSQIFCNFELLSNAVNHPQFSPIMQFRLVKTYIATTILNSIMSNNLINIKAFKQLPPGSSLINHALKSPNFSNFNCALLSKNTLRELEILPFAAISCTIQFGEMCFIIKFDSSSYFLSKLKFSKRSNILIKLLTNRN